MRSKQLLRTLMPALLPSYRATLDQVRAADTGKAGAVLVETPVRYPTGDPVWVAIRSVGGRLILSDQGASIEILDNMGILGRRCMVDLLFAYAEPMTVPNGDVIFFRALSMPLEGAGRAIEAFALALSEAMACTLDEKLVKGSLLQGSAGLIRRAPQSQAS